MVVKGGAGGGVFNQEGWTRSAAGSLLEVESGGGDLDRRLYPGEQEGVGGA